MFDLFFQCKLFRLVDMSAVTACANLFIVRKQINELLMSITILSQSHKADNSEPVDTLIITL